MSWRGLEGTNEFIIWAENNNIDSSLDEDGNVQDTFYNGIISSLKDFGKKDCL